MRLRLNGAVIYTVDDFFVVEANARKFMRRTMSGCRAIIGAEQQGCGDPGDL